MLASWSCADTFRVSDCGRCLGGARWGGLFLAFLPAPARRCPDRQEMLAGVRVSAKEPLSFHIHRFSLVVKMKCQLWQFSPCPNPNLLLCSCKINVILFVKKKKINVIQTCPDKKWCVHLNKARPCCVNHSAISEWTKWTRAGARQLFTFFWENMSRSFENVLVICALASYVLRLALSLFSANDWFDFFNNIKAQCGTLQYNDLAYQAEITGRVWRSRVRTRYK